MVYTGEYDEKIDIWGVGVCFYFMLTGKYPCPYDSRVKITRKNILENFWKPQNLNQALGEVQETPAIIEFLKKLMAYDPANRLSADEAYEIACNDKTWVHQ